MRRSEQQPVQGRARPHERMARAGRGYRLLHDRPEVAKFLQTSQGQDPLPDAFVDSWDWLTARVSHPAYRALEALALSEFDDVDPSAPCFSDIMDSQDNSNF